MKEIVALLFLICLTIYVIWRARTGRIGKWLTIVLLGFALFGGLAIANYDIIKKVKWKGIELETYERKIQTIKNDALKEIEASVARHKESIDLLISSLNDTREKIDVQKTAADEERQARLKIERRLAPRFLTSKEKTIITGILKAHAGHQIEIIEPKI